MLKWMCRVAKQDRIKKERIEQQYKWENFHTQMQENKLNLYGENV